MDNVQLFIPRIAVSIFVGFNGGHAVAMQALTNIDD